MQSFSSRIWTRVAVSISYDDNHNSTGTSEGITQNCFWWWDSSSGELINVEYPFIAIISRSNDQEY